MKERPQGQLATVNSAFLSGLFADVAKVHSEPDPSGLTPCEDPRENTSLSFKKPRSAVTGKPKSFSRNGRSYKILTEAISTLDTPRSSATSAMTPSSVTPTSEREAFSFSREDSLSYQLGCVSDSSSTDCTSAIKIAFPLLPTHVATETSVSIPRKVSDPELFSEDSPDSLQPKESYGWFVEMDGDNGVVPTSSSSRSGLAFKAKTAPVAVDHDAEVEWAKAADTVDDVLGDFF